MQNFTNNTKTCQCGYDLDIIRNKLCQRADDIINNDVEYTPNLSSLCSMCREFLEYELMSQLTLQLLDLSLSEYITKRNKLQVLPNVLKLVDDLMNTFHNIKPTTLNDINSDCMSEILSYLDIGDLVNFDLATNRPEINTRLNTFEKTHCKECWNKKEAYKRCKKYNHRGDMDIEHMRLCDSCRRNCPDVDDFTCHKNKQWQIITGSPCSNNLYRKYDYLIFTFLNNLNKKDLEGHIYLKFNTYDNGTTYALLNHMRKDEYDRERREGLYSINLTTGKAAKGYTNTISKELLTLLQKHND